MGLLNSAHDFVSLAVFVLCLLAVIHPRVPTGVLGTLGLGVVMIGILYSLDDGHDPMRALDVVIAGIGTIGVCLAWRVIRRPHRGMMRRAEDWQRDAAQTLPPDLRSAIRGGGKGAP